MIISIILPIYNGEKYLEECLSSIATQTLDKNEYELIAINDGSSDRSLDILKKYYKIIKNIRIISRENKGLIYSLNEGIDYASGIYICRMDADDIMLENRLKVQSNFLYNNLDYIACGTSYRHIGGINKLVIAKQFKSADEALAYMIFENPFAHPSMMIRKEIFDVFEYKDSALSCEDYSLWSSILLEGYKITNIPNILLLYRTHDNQISTKNAYQQNINVAYLTQRILKHFNINSFEESILQLQRPAYSKNKYDKNVENLFKETFMLPSLNSKIFYKHLSEYCFISEKGFLFYKKFFSLKYLGTFTSNIVLVFLDKKLIKNLFYGKK